MTDADELGINSGGPRRSWTTGSTSAARCGSASTTTGVISQFEGYDRLDELDWLDYQERYGDIQRLDRILEAEGDSTNRYKVSKQADVLMVFYLLPPDEFASYSTGSAIRSIRTPTPGERRVLPGAHVSRVHASWVVHSWVLARLDRRRSWDLFLQALRSDIADIQGGTTHEGIHLGAMAGTVDLIQRCYGGVEARAASCGSTLRCPTSCPPSGSCSTTEAIGSTSSSPAIASRWACCPRWPRRSASGSTARWSSWAAAPQGVVPAADLIPGGQRVTGWSACCGWPDCSGPMR